MKKAGRNIIGFLDRIMANCYLNLTRERSALLLFYFHGLLLNEEERSSCLVAPDSQRSLGVEHLRRLVEYFKASGYIFISPADVLAGLEPSGNYAMLTFDDGYYNNVHALPVLKEHDIPAVFFVSTNNVLCRKGFWWDVLYRERKKKGVPDGRIRSEAAGLKSWTSDRIEEYITGLFGPGAFTPAGDADRPFTPEELRSFAKERHVVLGNHTSDHAILTNYPPDGIRRQISRAQDALAEITGEAPVIISYPSGEYSQTVVDISREAGLKLGLTVNPGRNYLPLSASDGRSMALDRFELGGDGDFLSQLKCARSDISLYRAARRLMHGRKSVSV